MGRRYTYSTTLSFGTDGEADYREVDVEVSFTCSPGRAETPPSYSHGGLPAEGREIDDIRLETVNGRERPWRIYEGWIPNEDDDFASTVSDIFENNPALMEQLLIEAAEEDLADLERAAEARVS